MRVLKNKWAIIGIIMVIVLAFLFIFKKQIGPYFGGYEKSERGFYYRFTKGKKLEKVLSPGYHVIYQYLILAPNGDTLENKALPGVEQHGQYPTVSNNEIEDVLQLAAPESTVELLVPTDSLRKRAGNNLKIMVLPEGENAKFVFHILKILNPQEFEAYGTQRFMERLMRENKIIDDFAAKVKENWLLDSVKFIKYYFKPKTNAPRLTDGDEIEFHTEVYTLDGGLLISSNIEGKKYKIKIGHLNYDFEGFDAIARYLAPGENGTFLITSDYGYGDEGLPHHVPPVKPYTPLLVKMTEIVKLNK